MLNWMRNKIEECFWSLRIFPTHHKRKFSATIIGGGIRLHFAISFSLGCRYILLKGTIPGKFLAKRKREQRLKEVVSMGEQLGYAVEDCGLDEYGKMTVRYESEITNGTL